MPRNASINDMAEAIQAADGKPLTEAEIADTVGVARRTVGNHREKLQAHHGVDYRKIGKAWAYWWDSQNESYSPSQEKIANAIRETEKRAITAPEIADSSGLTVKTIYKHLPAVEKKNDDIDSAEIGGSRAYWSVDNH